MCMLGEKKILKILVLRAQTKQLKKQHTLKKITHTSTRIIRLQTAQTSEMAKN